MLPDNSSSDTPLSNKDAIEQQWRVYQLIQELIRFADAKAGAILTADGVLIGVILSLLKNEKAPNTVPELLIATVVAALLAYGISAWQCISCLLPRRATEGKSRIFFQHIADRIEATYKTQIQEETLASRLDDLNGQIYQVARLCKTKYDYVNVAIWSAAFGLFFTVAAALCAIFG